ncbi:MAG TPA: hypothetical protein VMV83_12325 [Rectinemataceae bacterium]|nr:hypothetical protein [Rectinemataceae bacterium]
MRKRLSLVAAAGVAVLSLTGCSNLFSLFSKPAVNATALSVQVVTEYKDSLTGSSTAKALSRSVATTLTASQIDALVAAAQAAVDSAGLHDSTAVDKIVAAMVQGVATQVQSAAASAQPIDLSSALVVAAQSAVTSIAKTGRESNVSTGLSTETAIAQVTAAMVKVTDSAIVDPQVRAATKAAMVTEAVAALDNADTVTTAAQASQAVASIVQQVAATQTSDAASFQAVLAAASTSAANLSKVTDPTAKATMAADVATAAVTAISDAKAAGSVVANEDDLVTAVAAEVGDIDPSGTTSVANAIQAAVTANTSLVVSTTVQSNISTIVSETAPTITSATAQIGIAAAASSVTVTATGQKVTLLVDATTSYSGGVSIVGWTRLSAGPQAVQDSTGAWNVTPATSGTFVYQVTVKNTSGSKTATATVTIVSTISVTTATDYMNQGMQYLGSQNIEAARAAFVNALAADPTNKDALFWKTFVDLMGVAVNPDFVSVMRDRFGFSGYPNTLSVLMTNTWMSQNWYGTKAGFVALTDTSTAFDGFVRGTFSASTSSGSAGYNYKTDAGGSMIWGYGTFTPSSTGVDYAYISRTSTTSTFTYAGNGLTVPGGTTIYTENYNLADLTKPYLLPAITAPTWAPKLGEQNTVAYYALVVLANVIDRNPSGLNAVLDSLVGSTGPFGDDFGTILNSLKSIASSDYITIPPSLITAMGGQVPTFPVQVTGAELMAFAAELELDRGLIQYIDSYDFTYPLSAFHIDFGDSTLFATSGIPSWATNLMASTPGPFKLTGTSKLLADRSQAMRNSARTSIEAAATDLIAAATQISADMKAGNYDNYIPQNSIPSGQTASQYAVSLAAQVDSDITTAQSFLDSVTTSGTPFTVSTGSGSTDVYIGKIFDSAVFSLPNLLTYDSSTSPVSPVVYLADGSGTYTQATSTSDWTTFYGVALQMNTSAALKDVWPDIANQSMVQSGAYLPLFSGSMPMYSDQVTMVKWLLGQ